VKVTNGEIYNSRESLEMLSMMSLPVLVSLQVAKLSSKLNGLRGIIESVRIGLVNKHGQTQESEEMVVIFPNDPLCRPVSPDWEKFASEYSKLMTTEAEVDAEPIRLPREVDGKPLLIQPSILIALEKFIEVEGKESEE